MFKSASESKSDEWKKLGLDLLILITDHCDDEDTDTDEMTFMLGNVIASLAGATDDPMQFAMAVTLNTLNGISHAPEERESII
jgi:hypothetical protein